MAAFNEHDAKADARGLKRQINELVYKLRCVVLRDMASRMRKLGPWRAGRMPDADKDFVNMGKPRP
jgi:hypothetical protein